jgi:tripartite-type tricarboxylate transporter receptor subunit TctC
VGEFVPGYETSQWYGLGAPKNTPTEIIHKLNKEINAALADPRLEVRLAEVGGVPLPVTLADFGRLIGTPQPILDKLTDGLDRSLDDHDVGKRLLELGGDIPGKAKRGQQPLAALVKSEIARWTPIIKATNIKGWVGSPDRYSIMSHSASARTRALQHLFWPDVCKGSRLKNCLPA